VAKDAPLSIVVIIANAARELPPKTIRRRVPPREELFAFVFVLSEDDDSDDDEDGEKLVLGRWSSSSSSSSSSGNTFRALLDAKETDDDDDGFDRDAERRRCRRRGGRREDAMVVVLPLVATRIFTSSINRVSLRVRFGFRSREREREVLSRVKVVTTKRIASKGLLLSVNIRAKAYKRKTNALQCLLSSHHSLFSAAGFLIKQCFDSIITNSRFDDWALVARRFFYTYFLLSKVLFSLLA
jgi:hypothetical protein